MGGIAVDITCRPAYAEQHAIEMMLEFIEDELTEADRIVIVPILKSRVRSDWWASCEGMDTVDPIAWVTIS